MDLIPPEVKVVMARLEEADARDRVDGTPYFDRLRAVDLDTGRLLHLLVLAAGARLVVELGASSGTPHCGWRPPFVRTAVAS